MGLSIDTKSKHPTDAMWLIGCNVAVFLIASICNLTLKSPQFNDSVVESLALPESVLSWISRPWTVLTYSITQLNGLHLLINMLFLYIFGNIWSKTIPGIPLIAAYLTGAITGAIAYWSYPSAQDTGLLTGASASILCIISAECIVSPNYYIYTSIIGKTRLIWIALPTIMLSISGLSDAFGSVVGHIGGIAGGLILAACHIVSIKKNKPATISQSLTDISDIEERIKSSGFDSLTHKEKNQILRITEKTHR